MAEDDLFQVKLDMAKHLSRNVPSDFTYYLGQVERSLSHTNHTPKRLSPRDIGEMASTLCDDPDDELKSELSQFVGAVWPRYEALNRSVDFHIAPRPVYAALGQVIATMEKAANQKLRDDFRDERVAQDRGLMSIEDLDLETVPFADAGSLAEKVSLVRLKLLKSAQELAEIRDHFEYKSSLTAAGKPGAYAMFYAVFALGDFFSRYNQYGEKAQVNTFKTIHAGRFLKFVHTFFRFANLAVASQAGDTFPEAVRKIAQKRVSDPECYKLIDGQSTTQDLLDFMGRIDRAR